MTCKILHESFVARFPANKFARVQDDTDAYQWNAHDHLK